METIAITHNAKSGVYSISYEWSDDIDPQGLIASHSWALCLKDAWQKAKRELMF